MGRIKQQKVNVGKNFKPTETHINKIDYPVFCFKHLHKDYSINSCKNEDKLFLIERLHKLSQMTWTQIQLAPKHGLGSEKIERDSIIPSIPAQITADVKFLALRYYGLKPIVGYRSGSIFHIVYIDYNFTVYPH